MLNMKLSKLILILTLINNCLFGQQSNTNKIRYFVLDDRNVYNVNVYQQNDGTTSIKFPAAINDLVGSQISVTGKADDGTSKFFVDWKEGNWYFSITGSKGTEFDKPYNLNIVFRKKIFTIHLLKSAREKAFDTVEFIDDKPLGKREEGGVAPADLVDLMDIAKGYNDLKRSNPESVAQILTSQPNKLILYPNFKVLVTDVFRFDREDTIIFKAILQNETQRDIFYIPLNTQIRVGTNLYPISVCDASGVIPAGTRKKDADGNEIADAPLEAGSSCAFFAITGDGKGKRNNLSIENNWNLLIERGEYQTE